MNGEPIRFSGKAQRVPLNLLKVIVALGGHEVSEARVIDALWPDAEGDAGEQALATTLSRLRKLVGTATVKRRAGQLTLDHTQCWVDCLALERTVLRGVNGAMDVSSERIRNLYRGAFLQGEGDAPWMLPMRERLHAGLIRALCNLGEAAIARRQPEAAAEYFELGLSIDNLVEEFYAGLIRCHALGVKPSQVASTYQRCRRVLLDRLGVAPSDWTTRLYRSAINGTAASP